MSAYYPTGFPDLDEAREQFAASLEHMADGRLKEDAMERAEQVWQLHARVRRLEAKQQRDGELARRIKRKLGCDA